MAFIRLQGTELPCLVDDEDVELLSEHKWRLSADGYAFTSREIRKDKWLCIRMHRLLLNAPSDMEVDHINFNILDNRRSNLRLCTKQENRRHRRKQRDTSSCYKGVHLDKHSGKWCAKAKVDSKSVYLGLFGEERVAAEAYNNFVSQIYGEYAVINTFD